MVKKFTIPFASQGDANDIPDALQVDGRVSFTQGFSYDYERPYDDPQAKDIAREDMNGLFKAITSAVGELQTLGASEWASTIAYPKGAIVYYEKDLYISQVDDNQNTPPQNWVSITSIANDSLKKVANLSDLTNKTTARSNLGLGNSATLNKTDVLGTSTNLVATQKLVNDTKINLENSKQDKLEFVGSGKVMREGAFGIGGRVDGVDFNSIDETGIYAITNASTNAMGLDSGGHIIHIKWNNDAKHQFGFGYLGSAYKIKYRLRTPSGWGSPAEVYHTINTTVDSSGFLRASGNKETFTKDLVSQSTGSSTTSVMSQKAVTDLSFGIGQIFKDVTSQRVKNTTYTNNSGKLIFVVVQTNTGESIGFTSCGVRVPIEPYTHRATFPVPPGEKYSVNSTFSFWGELME